MQALAALCALLAAATAQAQEPVALEVRHFGLDELSMRLLTIPVIFPTVMGLDLLGLAPEPKAIWLNGMARDVPMNESCKGVVPFLASDALRMLRLLFVPSASIGLLRWL